MITTTLVTEPKSASVGAVNVHFASPTVISEDVVILSSFLEKN